MYNSPEFPEFNLIKLKSYPMEYKTNFIASKRFYSLLPSTWNFPKVDSIFIYLRMDFSSDVGSKKYRNEKLFLWVNGALVGEIDPLPIGVGQLCPYVIRSM